ncbi:hypothetical protein D3C72_1824080 [compost metagenome]
MWMAPKLVRKTVPEPETRRKNRPSPPMKPFRPAHWVFRSTPMLLARYEPPCRIRLRPFSSIATMSPGTAGANVTSPAVLVARTEVMKKLSLAKTERVRAPMALPRKPPFFSPAFSLASSTISPDMLTIAPDSQRISSPGSSWRMASE